MAGSGGGSDDMRGAVQRVWGVLDKLYAKSPEDYEKFVSQQLEEGREVLAPPEPGFCLRTNTASDASCRLYINVCKWRKVPRPKTDQDPIPIKGGTLRHVVRDGKRTKHLVLDIAFSPSVIEECLVAADMSDMLISLCLDFVQDFISVNFDRKSCKKLPNKKFVGSQMDMHYSLDYTLKELLSADTKLDVGDAILNQLNLRTTATEQKGGCSGGEELQLPPLRPSTPPPSKKLIEELSSKPTAAAATVSGACGTGWVEPEHSVSVREAVGGGTHQRRLLVVKVTLPGLHSVSQVQLDVSREELELSSAAAGAAGLGGRGYRLALRLPAPVDEEQTSAAFSTRSSVLTVSMPCAASS